jgi:ABC-type branched-subunit amino acid transport system ATPase component/ABC-type branched-subunit amino acid transport system permease subunit
MSSVSTTPPTSTARPIRTAVSNPGFWLLALVAVGWLLVMPDYLVFSMTSAVPVALVALGLLVLQGWSREISLATAGLFATSMYYTGYFDRPEAHGLNMPWFIAALLAMGISGGLMALLALSSGRLPGIYLISLTLVLQILIEKIVYPHESLAGGAFGGSQIIDNSRPGFFGIDLTSDNAYYIWAFGWLVVVLVLIKRLRHSPMGLAFLLVGADRQAASSVGVSPLRFRVLAFVISGVLAGAGGVMACWLFVTPPPFISYLAPASLLYLAIPVLAGMDAIAWVVIVAAAFQVIPVVLESWHINVFLLAGVGLSGGALLGPRGAGGRTADLWKQIRFGNRQDRTRRERLETTTMRAAEGLAGDPMSTDVHGDMQECLDIVEGWLPPRPGGDVAVRAEGISVTIGGVRALDGATITVPTGLMVGLIGPNGAGKTTLFDVISGLRTPQDGRVGLFDNDVTGVPAWDRAKLGMARTFQTTRVIKELSVAENLLAGAYRRIDPGPLSFLAGRRSAWDALAKAEEAAWAVARLLDIDRYWNERAGTLEFSGRRRVEIGRALLAGPRVLLLDEPAAGLDPASSAALFNLIRKLHHDLGLTVLLVEHYVKAVLDTCDLVYVLAQGSVLASGTPQEISDHAEVREHYLGTRHNYLDKARSAAARAAGTPAPPGPTLIK